MRSRSSAIAVAVLLPERSTGLISFSTILQFRRHALDVFGVAGLYPGRHFMADRSDDELHRDLLGSFLDTLDDGFHRCFFRLRLGWLALGRLGFQCSGSSDRGFGFANLDGFASRDGGFFLDGGFFSAAGLAAAALRWRFFSMTGLASTAFCRRPGGC
jgi:hypothetical protein